MYAVSIVQECDGDHKHLLRKKGDLLVFEWPFFTSEPAIARRLGNEKLSEEQMADWIWVVGLVVAYVLLTRWLLPKLGIPT